MLDRYEDIGVFGRLCGQIVGGFAGEDHQHPPVGHSDEVDVDQRIRSKGSVTAGGGIICASGGTQSDVSVEAKGFNGWRLNLQVLKNGRM